MRLFDYLSRHPGDAGQNLFKKVLLVHLSSLLRENRRYRSRIDNLPEKYRYAMFASEIASSLVYRSHRDTDFLDMLTGHLKRVLAK